MSPLMEGFKNRIYGKIPLGGRGLTPPYGQPDCKKSVFYAFPYNPAARLAHQIAQSVHNTYTGPNFCLTAGFVPSALEDGEMCSAVKCGG